MMIWRINGINNLNYYLVNSVGCSHINFIAMQTMRILSWMISDVLLCNKNPHCMDLTTFIKQLYNIGHWFYLTTTCILLIDHQNYMRFYDNSQNALQYHSIIFPFDCIVSFNHCDNYMNWKNRTEINIIPNMAIETTKLAQNFVSLPMKIPMKLWHINWTNIFLFVEVFHSWLL